MQCGGSLQHAGGRSCRAEVPSSRAIIQTPPLSEMSTRQTALPSAAAERMLRPPAEVQDGTNRFGHDARPWTGATEPADFRVQPDIGNQLVRAVEAGEVAERGHVRDRRDRVHARDGHQIPEATTLKRDCGSRIKHCKL